MLSIVIFVYFTGLILSMGVIVGTIYVWEGKNWYREAKSVFGGILLISSWSWLFIIILIAIALRVMCVNKS